MPEEQYWPTLLVVKDGHDVRGVVAAGPQRLVDRLVADVAGGLTTSMFGCSFSNRAMFSLTP